MIIEIDKYPEPLIPFAQNFAPDEIAIDEQSVTVKNEIALSGEIHRKDLRVEITGKLQGTVDLECSRCLAPVKFAIESPFQATLVTLDEYKKFSSEELKSDELELSVFDGVNIDLAEIGREQILLALPAHPLCRENCLGICPQCGKDLNTEKCNCEKEADIRFAGLKDLL